jgi:error-prone DNA polymerase
MTRGAPSRRRLRRLLRLGFRQIDGLKEDEFRRLAAARGAGFDSLRDVWLRGGLTPASIERLARGDAFRSIGLDRREALWAARAQPGRRRGGPAAV